MTEEPLPPTLLESGQPNTAVLGRVKDEARAGGDAAAPNTEVPETDPTEAAVEVTPAQWEGLGAPHCPWQEADSDQVVSDLGPNPWAGYNQE